MALQLSSVEERSSQVRRWEYARWLVFNLGSSLIVCTLSDVSSYFSRAASRCLGLLEACVPDKGCSLVATKRFNTQRKLNKKGTCAQWVKKEWVVFRRRTLLCVSPRGAENTCDGMSFYLCHRMCLWRNRSVVCLPEKKKTNSKSCMAFHKRLFGKYMLKPEYDVETRCCEDDNQDWQLTFWATFDYCFSSILSCSILVPLHHHAFLPLAL